MALAMYSTLDTLLTRPALAFSADEDNFDDDEKELKEDDEDEFGDDEDEDDLDSAGFEEIEVDGGEEM
jgi:hypothetical protein